MASPASAGSAANETYIESPNDAYTVAVALTKVGVSTAWAAEMVSFPAASVSVAASTSPVVIASK